jgi:hypothetical protein
MKSFTIKIKRPKRRSGVIPTKKEKSKKDYSRKELPKNTCPDCRGKTAGYTDDYFVNRCYCWEIKDDETDWTQGDDYGP